MKNDGIRQLKEFIISQMNHWVVFTVAVAVMVLGRAQRPILWLWLLCSLLPYVYYHIRDSISGVFSNLFLHGLFAVFLGVLPCPDPLQAGLLRVTAVCYMAYSLWIKSRKEDVSDIAILPILAAGIIAISYGVALKRGEDGWDLYFIFPLVVYVAFYFLQHYMERYLRFLSVNSSSAGKIPAKDMFRSGFGITGAFTALGVLFLLLVSGLGWLPQVADWLKGILVWLVRKLAREGGNEEVAEIPEEIAAPDLSTMPALEPTEPSMFWKVLEMILVFFVSVAMLAATIMGLIFVTRILMGKFRQVGKRREKEVQDMEDVREKCQIDWSLHRKPLLERLTPRERIRRIFRKQVLIGKHVILQGRKSARLEVLTARECTDRLDQDLLGTLYEKARYSEEECTLEDIRALREEK